MATRELAALRSLPSALRVRPGRTVALPDDFDPGHTAAFRDKEHAQMPMQAGIEHMRELQARLAAQETFAILVVLQGMDASGKDGLIEHVMSGLNPQGVTVHSFKVPSTQELMHDYLWRYQQALPARGMIGIFNRSHYEEVLAVRVHPEYLDRQHLPQRSRKEVWRHRYDDLNNWERYLVDNGIVVLKLFLNVSREEQRRRFLARIDNPEKTWKFSLADVAERRHWAAYQQAYAEMLSRTSSEWAPWYVLPADHKWFSRLSAVAVMVDALEGLRPRYPRLPQASPAEVEQARAELEADT